MNKTARIEFVMTEEDAAKLKEYARMVRLPVSRLIRMILQGYRPKEGPGEEFYKDLLNKLWEEVSKMQLTAEVIRDPDIKKILRDTSENILKLTIDIQRKYLLPDKSNIKII